MPPEAEATPPFEHFTHGADIGVRGRGATLAEAFANAARALTAIVTDPARVEPREAVEVRCRREDPELLLVEFLNALIFEMATRRLLFRDCRVSIDGGVLEAACRGEAVDVARHQPAVEPKGATLTALRAARDADGRFVAQCVVDV